MEEKLNKNITKDNIHKIYFIYLIIGTLRKMLNETSCPFCVSNYVKLGEDGQFGVEV